MIVERKIRYASVCSGIEAPGAAWKPLGWEPVWFSEIENFPCKVLKHHYPDVPNLGDMTKLDGEKLRGQYGAIDVFIGGTPCQSFSVAGKRLGLDDPRGNLALEYCRIIRGLRPRWIVWENVPGVLSSNSGRDFGAFLGALNEIGYCCAWRVLDAQHFGVPQRRRRVFLVGYFGDWRYPAAVLFERESLYGNTSPCREKGKEVARAFTTGPHGGSAVAVSPTLDARCKDGPVRNQIGLTVLGNVSHALTAKHDASEDGTGRGTPIIAFKPGQSSKSRTLGEDTKNAPTLTGAGGGNMVPAICGAVTSKWAKGTGGPSGDECQNLVCTAARPRRLMPLECERLQGLSDGYTDIPDASDSARYKAIGNSMAVSVVRWIGERIQLMENNEFREEGSGKHPPESPLKGGLEPGIGN